jgi:1,4-dihydroxy-2-naphthoate octaprenyltransferase
VASLLPSLAAAALLLRRAGEPQRLRPAIVLTLLAAVLHGVLLAAAFLGIAALR